MALTNTAALCTLADLKDDLGITDASSDARLERRILSASVAIANFLRRPLRRTVNKVEALPGYGTDKLFPSLTPIESVSSVVFDGITIDPAGYFVDSDGLFIVSTSGWDSTALGRVTASGVSTIPGTEAPDFVVTYTGGWSLPNDSVPGGVALPAPIAEACLMLASTMHLARGSDRRVMSESVGGAMVSMRAAYDGDGSLGGFPKEVSDLLKAYRRAV